MRYEKKNGSLMRRMVGILVLLAVFALSAVSAFAEPDAAAFESLVAANLGSEILSRHGNFQMDRTGFLDEEEIYSIYSYRDAEVYYWYSGGGPAFDTLSRTDLWINRSVEEEGIVFGTILFDTEDYAAYSFAYARDASIIGMSEEEKLLETADAGDGLFLAVTQISDPALVSQFIMSSTSMGGYDYADGMILQYKYTFDTETGDLLEVAVSLINGAGEAHAYETDTYSYDVAPYDPAKEGEPFAEYLAAIADPEQARKVSVTFGANTKNEYTVDYTVPQYSYFNILYNGAYVTDIFSDRECTQLYEGSDGIVDLTLYVK